MLLWPPQSTIDSSAIIKYGFPSNFYIAFNVIFSKVLSYYSLYSVVSSNKYGVCSSGVVTINNGKFVLSIISLLFYNSS